MEVTQLLLIITTVVILLLLFLLLLPRIRKQFSNVPDDSLKVQFTPHPFEFRENPDNPLNERIIEAINRMGGIGDKAEEEYQVSLEKLRTAAEEAVPIIVSEYKNLPETQYLDRWSLIQLLAELKHPASLLVLDKILSIAIPPERSKNPRSFSTVREEIIIRTTAIEAITRVASEGNPQALDLLLKHTQHENFSVKRASIQGYLTYGDENARQVLLERLPKSDHYILDIRRKDIREVPQPSGGKFLKRPEKDDRPEIHPPMKVANKH